MKNLFTLFLILSTALGFAQQPLTAQPKFFKVDPNAPKLPSLHHVSGSNSRSSMGCDTVDALDYSTYDELNAAALQISFDGSWNNLTSTSVIAANEVTSSDSDINSHSAAQGYVSFAMAAFDTLAFANFSGQNQYSMSLAGSTISFDSMGLFIGIYGDTVAAHGIMANDSLVFRVYPITNKVIATTPIQSINFTGYAGLAPFLAGTGYLHGATFPVGITLGQGQGFAVRMEYYRADTSSHCNLAYSFADSCQTIVIQGTTYTSPAYPSPFINTAKLGNLPGSNFYGEIDSISPTSTTVKTITNADYFNLTSLGVSKSCSYYYIQNWEFIPFVTVTSSLGIGFANDTVILPCDGNTYHTISTVGTGDLAGATYSWSPSSQTTANITTTTPGTYSVTVTNPLNCTASATATVLSASGANVNASFNSPDSLCVGAAAGFVNTSSDVTGYTSKWTFGDNSSLTATNPVYTYHTAGTYPVTLTLDSAGCTFSTTQNVTVSQFCTGIQNIAFENNISIMPNPTAGNVNITINGVDDNVNITIFNVIGQAVKTYASSDVATVFNKNLDLNDLSGGTYLVKIQSGNKIATKKLVITK